MLRRWLTVFVVAVPLCGGLGWWDSSQQPPITKSEQSKAGEAAKEHEAAYGGPTFLQNADSFVRTYKDEIGALSAVVVAAFTVILGIWTVRLWGATKRLATTSERALTELERPFAYVEVTKRGVAMDGNGNLLPDGYLEFECINLGRTPADLWDLRDDILEIDKDGWPAPVVPSQGPRTLPPGTVAAAGRPCKFTINLFERIGYTTRGRNGVDTNLFFLGYVRYADIFGNRYITGFCAIHDPVSWRFVLRGDERYNYTRKE